MCNYFIGKNGTIHYIKDQKMHVIPTNKNPILNGNDVNSISGCQGALIEYENVST